MQIDTSLGLNPNGRFSDALKEHFHEIRRAMESPWDGSAVGEKLSRMLGFARENCGFYSNVDASEGLKLSSFPVVNKVILNERYDQVRTAMYANQPVHTMSTSGSTGIPFTVVQNMDKRERHIADLKYFGVLAGYRDMDPMCFLRAKPTATPEQQKEQNIWQYDISNLSESNLHDYYHAMIEKECVALIGYASTLDVASSFWHKYYSPNCSKISTVICTSESLPDSTREKLQAYFGEGCSIVSRYSDNECGVLGQEDGTVGRYRLNWASYYFEILKMDSDEPAEDGELGRVVVTDLYNFAFPMIRYDTGDVARFCHPDGEAPYIYDLYGRRMDLVYDTAGETVSPHMLTRIMRFAKQVDQWQFIQEDRTRYRLNVTDVNGERPDCTCEKAELQKILGPDAEITIAYVHDIPVLSSEKRKLIVSHLARP